MDNTEFIAKRFYETFEKLAPEFGFSSPDASAIPWENVPGKNRMLFISIVDSLIDEGTIQ